MSDYSAILNKINQKSEPIPNSPIVKSMLWFFAANAAMVLSVSIISGGELVEIVPFLLIWACLFPFISLLFSKILAIRSHRIHIIDPNRFSNTQQESLFRLVSSLSQKAGITNVPAVGIYESSDMNAFATGSSKNNSLIAFSSTLLDHLDEEAIAAVAAHEVAHIANGDMVTMSLLQSVINAIVLLITLPLSVIKIASLFSDNFDILGYWLISIVKFLLASVLLFLGSLVVKAFSRHREFEADKLASQLTDHTYMIHALESLNCDEVSYPSEQKAYAAFKINSPPAWFDIFSTHPSLERRIEALESHFSIQTRS